MIFKFKEGIVKFMNDANGGTASTKEVLENLTNDYSMRIIETGTFDEDHVGFKGSALSVLASH